jgi:hypothetical protein
MSYRLLADLIVILHFLWILFIVFGFIFALKRSRIAWLHLGGLAFSLLMNVLGWYCPLTYVENYLYRLHASGSAYNSSFVVHYLNQIVYPNLPGRTIRLGEVAFVCLNLVAYAVLAKKYLRPLKDR